MANKIQSDIVTEIDKLPEFNQEIIKKIIKQVDENKKNRDIRNEVIDDINDFVNKGENK